ncbi:MAG TPA: carotenoid oxygenase family protein, partial [Streptosporangiaceae bacterium]|nr:carotenoid oxygenase family protein [Streptosporangiaceae bacterium]
MLSTKVDDHTGELLFVNYRTEQPYLHYGVVDARERLAHYVPIDLPGPRLPHDVAYNYAATNEPGWFTFNGLVKHVTLTGAAKRYQFEPGMFCSEVGVAPRV